MRYIWFGLLGLLVIGGVALIIGHGISTEEVIGTVEGEKVPVVTMTWDGHEAIYHNLDGRDYAQVMEEPGNVQLYYSGKLKLRQRVEYNGKKIHAKYNESFTQSNGYDIKLTEKNRGTVFVLYVTPHWNVTRRNVLFWKLIWLKKKYLLFSYDALKKAN